MSAFDVIKALAEHWDDTLSELGADNLRLITESARRIEAHPDDAEIARDEIANLTTLLAATLPRGHPVRTAMSGQDRLLIAPSDLPRIVSVLSGIPALSAGALGAFPGPDAFPMPAGTGPEPVSHDAADADADAWLLAAPALTEQQVRDQGGDPGRGDLIKLFPADGQARLPEFQFGSAGQPIPVVATINRLLSAAEDPYGVADWWLGRNAWLNGIPAELLGHVEDELLVSAARAELAGE